MSPGSAVGAFVCHSPLPWPNRSSGSDRITEASGWRKTVCLEVAPLKRLGAVWPVRPRVILNCGALDKGGNKKQSTCTTR